MPFSKERLILEEKSSFDFEDDSLSSVSSSPTIFHELDGLSLKQGVNCEENTKSPFVKINNENTCFITNEIIIKNVLICNFYKENPQINIETVNLYIIELVTSILSPNRGSPILRCDESFKNEGTTEMERFNEECRTKLGNIIDLLTGISIQTENNRIQSVGSTNRELLSPKLNENKPKKMALSSQTTESSLTFRSGESINNIIVLLNKLYTTGSVTTVNNSTMMFSRKVNKLSKSSPKKKGERRFSQEEDFEENYGSECRTTEPAFENELCIIKRPNKYNILVENKTTEINVNNEEIHEFIQLMEENNCHGLFLSQNSGFFSKQDFHIEIYNKLIVVYVHNVGYNEQKIKMAIDLIDNLAIKIRELHRQEDIYEVIIDKEILEEINREYQMFIQQKENLVNIFKESQKQFFLQIEDFKFPELNKYLSTKFSIPTNKQGIKCDLCKKFNGNNLKALAAHKRGCMRKIKGLPLKKEMETNRNQEFSNREQENSPYQATEKPFNIGLDRDDKQTFLAEPSTESNRISLERNIEKYKENIYPSSSVGSPMICFEESSSNLFLNEKLPPLSGQREGKIRSNNFVTLPSQATEKPHKNRLEKTIFDFENTFSKDIILPSHALEKASNKKNKT